MNLKQLRQRDADLRGAIAAATKARADIGTKAVAENRKMTDEERQAFVAKKDEIAALEAQLAENTELLEAAEAANEADRAYRGATPNPDAAASSAAAMAAGIQVGRERVEDDPKRGFKSHREFLRAVMGYSTTNRMDARLKPLAAVGADEHGAYSDPSAGFLLPVAFSPDILSIQAGGDPIATLVRRLPMEAPMVKVRARTDKDHSSSVSGGLRVYRHSEASEATSSKMETELLSFDAHELMGLAFATESQISDSPGSFIAMLASGFSEEFPAKILQERLRGTGNGGQFLGVLNSPALITITKESGQAADTILKENIDKMAARCWRYSAPGTAYLANPTTRPQLRSIVQKVGTGGAPVPYFTQSNGQEYLDGRPIFFTEFGSALGDVGDLVLGNWAEYIEGTVGNGQVEQAESIHVRFTSNERAFKFWLRNAGMPWWRSPLTPKYGDTLSPFVTIEAR